jgi:hypothetical protein
MARSPLFCVLFRSRSFVFPALYVSLEITRVIQTALIRWDAQMSGKVH